MVSSTAPTVTKYLAELPKDRRTEVEILLNLVRKHIKPGYEEVMNWGAICFQVPLEVSGPTYNKQPLASVAIAAQKNYLSIYLMGIYASDELSKEFVKRWKASGKSLNMGKSCIRFKTTDAADLKTIAWACGLLNPKQFTKMYLEARKPKGNT